MFFEKISKGSPLCLCFLKKFQKQIIKGGSIGFFSPPPRFYGGAMAPCPPPLNAPLCAWNVFSCHSHVFASPTDSPHAGTSLIILTGNGHCAMFSRSFREYFSTCRQFFKCPGRWEKKWRTPWVVLPFFLAFPWTSWHVPRIHLMVGREGFQGRKGLQSGVCLWCVTIMWPNPSAVEHVKCAKRYSEMSCVLALFVWPLSIDWPERKCEKIFSHTKRKRRLKNDRPCKPSRPAIKCIRGTGTRGFRVFPYPRAPLELEKKGFANGLVVFGGVKNWKEKASCTVRHA